jgi:hypothetical protein
MKRQPYQDTSVPVGRTQEALRKLMQDNKGFGLAIVSEQDLAGKEPPTEGFEAAISINETPYRIRVKASLRRPNKYTSDRQKQLFREQEERRVWRVLYYHMKSVFEAHNSGVMELREMMLPYIIVPATNKTIGQHILPRMKEALEGRLLAATSKVS